MKIKQKYWTSDSGWNDLNNYTFMETPQIVFVFGGRALLEDEVKVSEIISMYPDSNVLMSSTAGEILGTTVRDNSIALTAIYFEKTNLEFVEIEIDKATESFEKGIKLASSLKTEGLRHVLVFSDGLRVNGSALVDGISKVIPKDVVVTGGLVGDGGDFKKTVIGLNNLPKGGKIVLVGIYGEQIAIGHGSLGGWDTFGPRRMITKSNDNVLLELDGKPALELYKEYLGEEAEGLPETGLLFPLNLYLTDEQGNDIEVVRTLLGINEEDNSMTFAGDLPEGSYVNLMKANFEKLVDGAEYAAKMSLETFVDTSPEFALLISCIGRKLVLKDRVEEETEAVQKQLGETTIMTGFYSYGEISPVAANEKQCQLHNQTMTITTFKEL